MRAQMLRDDVDAGSRSWRCIAYTDDGRICGQPATMLDVQRGGMVCAAHAPAQASPPAQAPPGKTP